MYHHCRIEKPQEFAIAEVSNIEDTRIHTVRRRRKAIFETTVEELVNGVEGIVFEGAVDVQAKAELCASKILAGECEFNIAVRREDGVTRVISRVWHERFPHRYEEIKN